MNIIKIILYPSPLAPFFGNEEDLKLRCKLEWPNSGTKNTKHMNFIQEYLGGARDRHQQLNYCKGKIEEHQESYQSRLQPSN